MKPALAWLAANPQFCVLILWPALTGIFNFIFRKRTEGEYQAMNPRISAVFRFFAATGLDSPKLIRTLQQVIKGVPVLLPGTAQTAEVKAVSIRPPALPSEQT